MFVGNSSISGIPLNILLPILIVILSSHFSANITQLIMVISSTFIFLIYAIKLNLNYSAFYPLWIISFFLGYFYIRVFNLRINKHPNSLLKAQFLICLALLVIFSLGITSSIIGYSETGRAEFIFGSNMLYRIIGFLSGICAGYLLYNNRLPEGIFVALISLALLIMTGSRAALLLLPLLFLLWCHASFKKLLFSKLSITVFVIVVLLVLIGTQIDFAVFRIFNFSSFSLDESLGYEESYVRWQPYLYLLLEDDRFSLIGMDYQTWIDLFHHPYFLYPHSILLELLMFYGIFGLIFSGYIIFKVTRIMRALMFSSFTSAHITYYAIIVSSIGSLFSGDMGDNGVFLGMFIGMSPNIVQPKKSISRIGYRNQFHEVFRKT